MKRIIFSIVILLVTNVVHAQFALHPGTTLPFGNLQAWYPFCNNTVDQTFTGYDLLSSNVTATTDRFGQINKAWLFNGSNSDMHYTTIFPLSTLVNDIGYSVWIYPTGFQNSVILHNGNPNTNGIGILMNDGLGGAGNLVGLSFPGFGQQLNTAVTINQWHHLVLTRNGNGFYFYVDGNPTIFIPPIGAGFTAPTTVFQVGTDNSDGTNTFLGKIDDIAIYDRFLSNLDVVKLHDYTPDIVFSLGNDTVICLDSLVLFPDTATWRNSLYSGTPAWYGYSWSSVPPIPADDKSKHTVRFPHGVQAPPVSMVLRIDRPLSCATTHSVTVTHVVPRLNLGNDTIYCVGGAPFVLHADPPPGSSYLWNTGATTNTIPVTVTGYYSVQKDSIAYIGADTVTCIAIDTIKVTVAPHITATLWGRVTPVGSTTPGPAFMLPPDTILCLGGTINIQPIETYGNPTFIWQDGITIASAFTATATGTYWVQVTDSTCIASDTAGIAIVFDTVTVFTPDTAICKGATFVGAASFDPAISYQWLPTSGIPVSNISTPTITPDTSAWYVLIGTITVNSQTCHIRDSFYVDVQPYPVVNMGGNRNICKYDTIHITPVVTPGWYTHYTFDWTPGTFLDDSDAPNVVFTAGDTTKLVLVVTTPAGCRGADSVIIYKYNGNFASMASDTIICPGDTVRLFPTSTEPGITSYVWHPATYIDDSISANPLLHPITSMSYVGIAKSQYGCKDTLIYSVTVKPAAVITMTDSVVLFPGETYQISPTTNGNFYRWFPDIGLSDTGIINPIANPPVSTMYYLGVRTEEGCFARDSINIRLDEHTILTVPNAFTPGTAYNYTIKAILKGIARLRYFRIYNRYGNLIFDGKNIDDGWDGTFNGKPQPVGVYVYEAEAVTDKGKIIQKQGNITLLR